VKLFTALEFSLHGTFLARVRCPLPARVVYHVMYISTQQFLLRTVAQQPQQCLIAECAFSLVVHSIDRFPCRFQQQPHPRFFFRQLLLAFVSFADQSSQHQPRQRQNQHQKLQQREFVIGPRIHSQRQNDSRIQRQDRCGRSP
jgi:hypothetical protein